MAPAALLSPLSHHHIPVSELHQALNTYVCANIAHYLLTDLFQGRQDPETSAQVGLRASKGILEVCGIGIVHADQEEGVLLLRGMLG